MARNEKMIYSLNGAWQMCSLKDQENTPATVPGSVLNDLLNAGKIADPFWRDNEYTIKQLFYEDYRYEREFELTGSQLEYDQLELVCLGLDTLSELFLNDTLVATTDNMHRTWRFDVKNLLREGRNRISIVFRSPLNYLENRVQNSDITYTSTGCIPGNQYLRKAHCMFGWDWGPQLPDAGIWRDIFIEGNQIARFEDIYINQEHTSGRVKLKFNITTEKYNQDSVLLARCRIISPDGLVYEGRTELSGIHGVAEVVIEDPKLWWPNGYGEQPLYQVICELVGDGSIVDSDQRRIGLRTMTVSQEKDQWGKEFAIMVNGVKIFAMGADYIPEDNIIARITREKTEKLVQSCVQAHFNCLRVWGGAYYPEDDFYDLCDEYGLVIWQDLMFACNVYEMSEQFSESITKEIIDNVKRLRHHASLGLWCGNNEMEWGWVEWDQVVEHGAKYKADYIRQFEILLPGILKQYDPETFYWPASPSSGGCFDQPNDKNRGDVHDWEVWHGFKPFENYRKSYYRFTSEFGFESFPCLETVKSFTLEEDRNIFSKVMEDHQKCPSGNSKILSYLAENFKYPKDFESLLYVSQLLQMEGVRYGVEHWRRYRGRCMGAIYWQLNDCWPVASWASVDYFGRWKALQYGAKRFFAPLMVSIEDEGTLVKLFVHNETMQNQQGRVTIRLKDKQFHDLYEATVEVNSVALSAEKIYEMDFNEYLEKVELRSERFLEVALEIEGKTVSSATHIFTKAKHFNFDRVSYQVDVEEEPELLRLTLRSSGYAKYVELSLKDQDCIFSNNYFDLSSPEGMVIALDKKQIGAMRPDEIKDSIRVRSVVDSF